MNSRPSSLIEYEQNQNIIELSVILSKWTDYCLIKPITDDLSEPIWSDVL